MPAAKDTKKDLETDATKAIKAAMSLSRQAEEGEFSTGISLPPILSPASTSPEEITANLISAIARDIVFEEAHKARNMAKLSRLQSEMELQEAVKKKDAMERGETTQPASPPGLIGGLIGGNTKSAVVKAVLDSLPPEKRAEWLEKNKDLITESPPNKPDTQPASAPTQSSLADLATLMSTMSREQREYLTWLMSMKEMLSPQQQQNSAQQTYQQMTELIREINQQNKEMLMQITNAFSESIKQIQQVVQDIQHESKAVMMDMQQKLLDAQRELYETRSQAEIKMMQEKLELLKRQAEDQSRNVPQGVLTINDIPMIKQMLSEVGLSVGTQNVQAEIERRKWDLEEKKLELEHERQQRLLEMEMEKERARTNQLELFKTIISSATNAAKIEEAMKKQTPAPLKKITARIPQAAQTPQAGGV